VLTYTILYPVEISAGDGGGRHGWLYKCVHATRKELYVRILTVVTLVARTANEAWWYL
jgi:hypothetical protein